MEDHQYIMTTSMFQYLEDMDNLLKDNTVKPVSENLMDLYQEDHTSNLDGEKGFNLDQIPEQSMEFDFGGELPKVILTFNLFSIMNFSL